MKKRRKAKWLFCIIAGVVFVLILSASYFINRSVHNFTIAKWQQVEDRQQIVDSLLNKHNLAGMTQNEIEGLLGSPSRELNGHTWIYDLAVQPEMQSLVIIPFLRIEFEDGLVKSYEVDHNA